MSRRGYAELREAKKRTGTLPPGAAPSFSSSSNRIRRPICREMMSSPAPRRRRTTGFPLIGHLRALLAHDVGDRALRLRHLVLDGRELERRLRAGHDLLELLPACTGAEHVADGGAEDERTALPFMVNLPVVGPAPSRAPAATAGGGSGPHRFSAGLAHRPSSAHHVLQARDGLGVAAGLEAAVGVDPELAPADRGVGGDR